MSTAGAWQRTPITAPTHRLTPTPQAAGFDLLVDGTSSPAPSGMVDYKGSSYTLSTNTSYDSVYVGYTGTGTLTQNGGSTLTLLTTGALFLGYNAGSNGTYTVNGNGTTLSTGNIVVGLGGSGFLNQNAATSNVSTNGNSVYLAFFSGSRGQYNLSTSSTLTTGSVYGGDGTSLFYCYGGTLRAAADNTNFMSGLTTVALKGGDSSTDTSAGTPDLIVDTNGHNITISQGISSGRSDGMDDGGFRKIGAGTLTMTGNSNFTGAITVAAGTLNMTAGTLGAPGYYGGFYLSSTGAGAAATLNLSGGKLTSYAGYIGGNTDGSGGTGVFNQTGGSFDTSARLFMVGVAGGNGTYNLSAGTLNAGTAAVGCGGSISLSFVPGGTGVFNQTGGSFGSGDFYVGGLGGNGTYNFSAGTLNTGPVAIGAGDGRGSIGTGTFTQTGGSFTTRGGEFDVAIGGATGTYALSGSGSGSTLTTGLVAIGVGSSSKGTVTQTGGTFSASGDFYLGGAGGTGTYTISGGSLSTARMIVGDSSGGISGSTGTFNLDGGTVTMRQVMAGSATTSTFHFNGGTLLAAASDNPSASTNPTTFFAGLTTADVRNIGAVINTAGYNVTVAQALVHSTVSGDSATDGGLTKRGVGVLTLTGVSTYTGGTSVNGGTLAVNGSLRGFGMVSVNSNATLAGTGSINANVQVNAGGTFSPGQFGAGRLALSSSLTLNGATTTSFTLGGTAAGSQYTQTQVGLAINLGTASTLSLTLASGYTPRVGDKFFLLDTVNPLLVLVSGTFANAPTSGSQFAAGGVIYQINYQDIDPNDPSSTFPNDVSVRVVAMVPEPGTWALVAGGALGLLSLRVFRGALRLIRRPLTAAVAYSPDQLTEDIERFRFVESSPS